MSRFEAWTLHVATLLVGGTGLVYAWMRYLATPADPFAVVNHPWQPALQHGHVWAAPVLVFGIGLIWREHIWKHFRRDVCVRRSTGVAMLLTLVPMVASGYLLQTAVEPSWRKLWVVIHLVASGLWILGYGGHLLTSKRKRQSAA